MRQGFAMLLSVVVLAAIGVAIATTLMLLSVSNAQSTATTQESEQARALANACIEYAFQQLITKVTYLGTGSLTLSSGTCAYTVSTLDATDDLVTSSSTVGQTTRKVRATITTSLLVTSWQEVGDY